MFETGTQTAEYGQPGYGRRRWRQRCGWPGEAEGGYPGEFGEGEGPYGEGEGPYGEGEGPYGEGEGPYGEGEGEGEEQFLPIIPIVGKALMSALPSLLPSLLGGLRREAESEYAGEYGSAESGQGEAGEAEEQFLHQILTRILGQEAESGEAALSPEQEEQFAARLLQVSNEQELEQFLGGIVNAVGRAVQGIRGAVNSPQGRAFINAITPLARAALPAIGGAIGSAIAPGAGTQIGSTLGSAASSLFEAESDQEQEQFEAARRFVQLASGAARNVAMAPVGAPPELVGELGVVHEAWHRASPVSWSNVTRRLITPFVRGYGGRYRGFRRGWGYGRPSWRYGYGGRRYWGGRYWGPRRYWGRYGYGYGYPPQAVEPAPEPGAPAAPDQPPSPQPGYRWVAVPIGASAPPGAAPEPPAPPPGAAPPEPGAAPQSEFGYDGPGPGYDRRGDGPGGPAGRWVRRGGKIIVLGA